MTVDDPTPRFADPTRMAGAAAMQAFAPRMGQRYAARRNVDRGAGRHRDVSSLSPFIRRRLVLERDVVATALAHHGAEGAEKFIQEVIWRGYFKGWLERRPQVWARYRDGLQHDLMTLDRDRRLRGDLEAAEAGRTGLACFDAWAGELVETGYLHNHARMWFASIWIFTLGLSWRLGADFFLRHLLEVIRRPIRWAGVGWPGCTRGASPTGRRHGTSPGSPITASRHVTRTCPR